MTMKNDLKARAAAAMDPSLETNADYARRIILDAKFRGSEPADMVAAGRRDAMRLNIIAPNAHDLAKATRERWDREARPRIHSPEELLARGRWTEDAVK